MSQPFETAKEHLAAWDSGDSVWSIEMGGLGPGYEQAIQVLAIEIIRDNIDKALPESGSDAIQEWGYDTLTRIDKEMGGMSGAQAGAARQIAYRFLAEGPKKALSFAPEDRQIQVSNSWPMLKPK